MSKTINLGPVSAYALAKKHGYTGTETEWLASLGARIGENGNWWIGTQDTGVLADPAELRSLTQQAQAAQSAAETAASTAVAAEESAGKSADAAQTAKVSAEKSASAAAASEANAKSTASAAATSQTEAGKSATAAQAAQAAAEAARQQTTADAKATAEARKVVESAADAETARVEAEKGRAAAENERASKDAERDGKISALDSRLMAVSEELSKGIGSSETTDAVFRNFLDGTNTTSVFESWWPLSVADGSTKYDRLCRWAEIMAAAWAGKTYTLRSIVAEKSGGVSDMTPMDDLAGKQPAQLCTEATAPVVDWADEDPMTWYVRANALSKKDGTMDVLAIEGVDDTFDLTGELAPVYTFALALWIKEWTEGSYDYISFKTAQADGFYPFAGDVGLDNEKRAITWHPTFPGGLDSKGALGSGAGQTPVIFTSAINALPLARKVTAYEGLWNDCDTIWILRMWQLRHFNLENSNIAEGCTSYNLQYRVAASESGVKRVLVSTSQGANFIVGSTVSVGDPGSNSNLDRGNGYMGNIAHLAKIASIENVNVSGNTYTALNLELSANINVTATTYVSTMPWHSGSTEVLPGRKDGCRHSLTAGRGPLRVAGVEVLDGAYALGLDPLYSVSAGSASGKFTYKIYEQRDSEKLSDSVSGYKDTGLSYADFPQGWQYVKAFLKTKLGVLFPRLIGDGSTTYFKSAFSGAASAVVRSPWRFCDLRSGRTAGLAGGHGGTAPSRSDWCGRPRLCGAGKKRGEWKENA